MSLHICHHMQRQAQSMYIASGDYLERAIHELPVVYCKMHDPGSGGHADDECSFHGHAGPHQESALRLVAQQLICPLPCGSKAADGDNVQAHPEVLVHTQHRQNPAATARRPVSLNGHVPSLVQVNNLGLIH